MRNGGRCSKLQRTASFHLFPSVCRQKELLEVFDARLQISDPGGVAEQVKQRGLPVVQPGMGICTLILGGRLPIILFDTPAQTVRFRETQLSPRLVSLRSVSPEGDGACRICWEYRCVGLTWRSALFCPTLERVSRMTWPVRWV